HLAIPLGPALTASGVARMRARDFIASPAALGFDRAFVNPAKTAIMGVQHGEVVPVFALVSQVTLKPAGYLSTALADNRAGIAQQLGSDLRDDLNAFGRGETPASE